MDGFGAEVVVDIIGELIKLKNVTGMKEYYTKGF